MGRVETSVHGRVGTSSLLFKFHWGNMKQFLICPCGHRHTLNNTQTQFKSYNHTDNHISMIKKINNRGD